MEDSEKAQLRHDIEAAYEGLTRKPKGENVGQWIRDVLWKAKAEREDADCSSDCADCDCAD